MVLLPDVLTPFAIGVLTTIVALIVLPFARALAQSKITVLVRPTADGTNEMVNLSFILEQPPIDVIEIPVVIRPSSL